MTLFARVLQPNEDDRTRNRIIGWWERRRIVYNAILLVSGSITLLIGYLLGRITLAASNDLLAPVLLFTVAANLFYTMGWVVEIASQRIIAQKEITSRAGPVLFVAGTCFSLFVTFFIDVVILFSYFISSGN